jgi:ketosteroid isomerase-like protein
MRATAPIAALALAACAHAPSDDMPASLAAAESAFAAHSVRADMRVAFLEAFAPDGVFVRGGWIVSNDFLRGRPAPPIVLDWRPQYVEVAATGEMGLSTGPSKITSREKPDAPPSYGQFVSIWRRQGAGPWKVEVDLGIQHAGEALWQTPLEKRQLAGAAAGGEGLAQAEARFEEVTRTRGARAAYAAFGADNLRFYRTQHAPTATRTAALASAAMSDERLAWTVDRSEVARSNDFGYVRGAYAGAAEPGRTLGWYLRVWRREASGWRIAMDVANPAPK